MFDAVLKGVIFIAIGFWVGTSLSEIAQWAQRERDRRPPILCAEEDVHTRYMRGCLNKDSAIGCTCSWQRVAENYTCEEIKTRPFRRQDLEMILADCPGGP